MLDDLDFAARVARLLAEAARAEDATTMSHLADLAGDDQAAQMWADQGAWILNQMSTEDLGLVVIANYNDRAYQEARRLWSQLWTTAPKDVKA